MIGREIMELKRMRRLCGVRQIDVFSATGITPSRLSRAESGTITLSAGEIAAIRNFLAKRWEMEQSLDQESGGLTLALQEATA